MFVDACAIVSIVTGEETAAAYDASLSGASDPFTSPLAAFEAIIVLARPDHLKCSYAEAEALVVAWLAERHIDLREPTSPVRSCHTPSRWPKNTVSANAI